MKISRANLVRIDDWIRVNVRTGGYGECREKAHALANNFPELEVRFGFFHSMVWGRRQHFWCRVRGGRKIIDPTGAQHPDGFTFPTRESASAYEDLTDKPKDELRKLIPTGVCMDCGNEVYEHATFCNDRCAKATAHYINGGEE